MSSIRHTLSGASGCRAQPAIFLLPLAVPLTLLIAWQCAASLQLLPVQILPPLLVATTALDLIRGGEIIDGLRISVWRIGVGFAIGAGSSLIFGALLGRSRIIENCFGLTFKLLAQIPSLGWLPILLLIFGLDETLNSLSSRKGASSPSPSRHPKASSRSRHIFVTSRAFCNCRHDPMCTASRPSITADSQTSISITQDGFRDNSSQRHSSIDFSAACWSARRNGSRRPFGVPAIAQARSKAVLAYGSTGYTWELPYVAEAAGLWQQNNVDLATSSFETGRASMQALLSGSADFSASTDTPLAFAALTGLRPVAVIRRWSEIELVAPSPQSTKRSQFILSDGKMARHSEQLQIFMRLKLHINRGSNAISESSRWRPQAFA